MENIKFNEYLSKQLNDHHFKAEFDKEIETLKTESVIESSLFLKCQFKLEKR